jgi:hypothetical protein
LAWFIHPSKPCKFVIIAVGVGFGFDLIAHENYACLQAMSNDEEVAGGFPADRIIFVNDVFFCWQVSTEGNASVHMLIRKSSRQDDSYSSLQSPALLQRVPTLPLPHQQQWQ